MAQPDKVVTIIGIEDGGESSALRTAAEALFLRVNLIRVGEAADLLGQAEECSRAELVVLCCHGVDGNIAMPDIHESLWDMQPFVGSMTPRHVRDHLALAGARVLNTACSSGKQDMASAFLDAGCEWYVAPTGDIDSTASFIFAVNFMYYHLTLGVEPERAVSIVGSAEDDTGSFRLYRPQVAWE